ncbi:alpha/beta hydrolase family protein [Williamsia sp. 1135]|uniref:alpha/beta hydrolase n=1 Tax=Williamsia sp. 1135 TaxID=1889262 RepID=UPI000A0F9062|nr:alpha/beta hydrolase family protein [Williamsia sp. 1135]ORM32811.1 esterase [Williamsia sp. 1135]
MPAVKSSRILRSALAVTVTSLVAATTLLVSSPASADELPQVGISSPGGSSLVSVNQTDPQQLELQVFSASMNKNIPISVLLPKDRSVPRPTLYLLNGAGGGEDAANWQAKTDIVDFFKNKNVNVITPNSGAFSYYTDWQQDDPELGRNKWSTFLGKELPPIIDEALDTNGRNSIAGISSSATSVLNLAIEHQGLYQSVGSYSGCASTASQLGENYIRITVEGRGGGDATNMWGPYGGPGWIANDAIINAPKLRGQTLYISNATGLPGQYDSLAYTKDPASLADQIILGGGIEAATGICTALLVDRLNRLNIPATYDFPPAGTHSWHYWEDQLHKSWPTLARPLGL